MAKEKFSFKQFDVYHDKCAMKVGTDGVLIGAWAEGGRSILDIGTGTGLVAMMMAQRFPNAHIDAIDIDHDAYCQARENIAKTSFAERINVVETSLQQHHGQYDAIVSNPPFFENSLKAPDGKRSVARHADSLPVAELMRRVYEMLTDEGVFSAVIPTQMLSRYEEEAAYNKLALVRICKVKTVERKPAKRCLIMIKKRKTDALHIEEHLLMNTDGSRSDWYQELTSEFYL